MGKAKISGSITREEKLKIKGLVKRGAFESMSEFYRVAIKRLLMEIEDYKIKRKKKSEKYPEKDWEAAQNLKKELDGYF